MNLLSVSEAAHELHLDPSRVRALVSSGELPAVKVGGRWAVERADVLRRKQLPRPAGRPFAPANAWGVLFIASGLSDPWLESSVRWRLRQGLSFRGLEGLLPRLSGRAELLRFRCHPGELKRLVEDRDLIRSGISAAGDYALKLAAGEEVDGYIRAGALERIQHDHALEPVKVGRGNVVLRVVPDQAWHLDAKDEVAPIAAVAADLAEDPDSRSARVGRSLVQRLDRQLRRSR